MLSIFGLLRLRDRPIAESPDTRPFKDVLAGASFEAALRAPVLPKTPGASETLPH